MKRIIGFALLLIISITSCNHKVNCVKHKRKLGVKNTALEKQFLHPKRHHNRRH